ncbi:hypothetical protein RAS2_00470 [Phycisphaerae bacterium RAS2]|nr:hypothetical protein RAS2_00470 [Phycisphaerae bacterium RAS2]
MSTKRITSSCLDQLAPFDGDSAAVCFERAVVCNHLAKLARGRTRARLYVLKNANLRMAIKNDAQALKITIDNNLHVGLLSVRLLNGDANRSIHTHENWINAA